LTTEVIVKAHVADDKEVSITVSEDGKMGGSRILQNGEEHSLYIYDGQIVSVKEVMKGDPTTFRTLEELNEDIPEPVEPDTDTCAAGPCKCKSQNSPDIYQRISIMDLAVRLTSSHDKPVEACMGAYERMVYLIENKADEGSE
jgi:hypothetical protein